MSGRPLIMAREEDAHEGSSNSSDRAKRLNRVSLARV